MRTSESVPVRYFDPPTPAPCNLHQPRPELIVLAQVAADLMQWLDSSWIVGLASLGRELSVACVMGSPPDLQACLECVTGMRPFQQGLHCIRARGKGLPALLSPIPNALDLEPLLAIGPKNGNGDYSRRDCEFVTGVCEALGALLVNAPFARVMSSPLVELGRMRSELETVRELHERFLPATLSQVPGLDYHGCSERCGRLGGDFFGFLHPERTELTVTLGKVAPAGPPAALLAAGLQASLRTMLEHQAELADVLRNLNRMMWEVSPGDVLASLFCARVIPSKRRLVYVSAGQETVFLLRASNRGAIRRVLPIEGRDAMLGLSHRSSYLQRSMAFDPGDTLIAASEGVTDAIAPGNASFANLFPEILEELGQDNARDAAALILDAVKVFSGQPAHDSDRTVTVVRSDAEIAQCSVAKSAPLPGSVTRAAAA